MYNFIVVFFPSLLSVTLENKLLKQKYSKNDIIKYVNYCLINNFIVVAIFTFLFGANYDIWNSINLYPRMTLKYGVLSIILALVCSFVYVVVKKNVGIEIEVKKK